MEMGAMVNKDIRRVNPLQLDVDLGCMKDGL